jgi:hypothetical protein
VGDEAYDADRDEDHPERNRKTGMMKRTSQTGQDHHDGGSLCPSDPPATVSSALLPFRKAGSLRGSY